jgi:hypothetical protein
MANQKKKPIQNVQKAFLLEEKCKKSRDILRGKVTFWHI